MPRRILITGCAGFIGSNLAKKCVEKGWVVDGVDDMSNGHREFLPEEVCCRVDDFSSPEIIANVSEGEYDYVFHLAAQPRVSYSVENPCETNDTNVSKTLRLMEACRGKVKRFIFASSSAVYGNSAFLPTSEVDPKSPLSPYGLQKLIIEDYLQMFYKLYGLDSACLRFFNVFGPNQLGDSPYSTAVSAWLHAIYSGGSMRSDGDGTQTRDMVHVSNVVSALLLAAEHKPPLKGVAFNVGTGDSVANNEILEYLMARFPTAKSHSAPPRMGDAKHTRASIKNIEAELGYKVVKDFWTGLDETIKWAEENKSLFLSRGKK